MRRVAAMSWAIWYHNNYQYKSCNTAWYHKATIVCVQEIYVILENLASQRSYAIYFHLINIFNHLINIFNEQSDHQHHDLRCWRQLIKVQSLELLTNVHNECLQVQEAWSGSGRGSVILVRYTFMWPDIALLNLHK